MREGMFEGELPGVKAEQGGGQGQRLGVASAAVWQVDQISAEGKAELPEVNPDLIRAPGPRTCFD